RGAYRWHGPATYAARALLQAGAAGSNPRLRHARQGRVGAPRGLSELEAPRREAARAPDRDRLGQGRGQLCPGHGRHRGGPARPVEGHLRRSGAREDQRHRGAHAEPRRARFHALHLRRGEPRAAEARLRGSALAEGRDPRGARLMEAWLSHPAVQAGLAPFAVGLLVAAIGMPLRLAGLAAAAGFATALYLTGNFVFEPLTALRKLALVGMGAGLLGWVTDLAFKPARTAGIMLGLLAGAASTWVFSTVLMQRLPLEAAGTSFTLAAGLIASLLASGALLLAKLPWHAAAALALVPAAVRLPLPERGHPALQAVVASIYALAVAALACALAWLASRH